MAEEDDLMQLAEIADLLEDIEELEELEELEEEANEISEEELDFARSMVLLQRKIDGGRMLGKAVSVEPEVRDMIDKTLNSPAGELAKEQLSLKGLPPLEVDEDEVNQMLEDTTVGVPLGDQRFTTMNKKEYKYE